MSCYIKKSKVPAKSNSLANGVVLPNTISWTAVSVFHFFPGIAQDVKRKSVMLLLGAAFFFLPHSICIQLLSVLYDAFLYQLFHVCTKECLSFFNTDICCPSCTVPYICPFILHMLQLYAKQTDNKVWFDLMCITGISLLKAQNIERRIFKSPVQTD